MPIANLNREKIEVNDGLDSIVIINALADIPGGRTLDVSGLPSGTTVVKAGHILIQKNEDQSVLPMPLNSAGTAYASLPSGHSFLGVLKATVLVSDPRAAILTAGQVNAAASPAPVTSAIKSGLPRIEFLY